MWRTWHRHVFSQTFWLLLHESCVWKRESQTLSWKWNSAVLNQLPFPPGDLCSVVILFIDYCNSWLTPWKSVHQSGCVSWGWNGRTSTVYITGCRRLTLKGSRSGPLSFSSIPLLLSSSLPQPRTIRAAELIWDLRTWELLSLSLSFLPLILSPLASTGLSMVVVFYPILCSELCCGSRELVVLCFGLFTSKVEQFASRVEILFKVMYCKKIRIC